MPGAASSFLQLVAMPLVTSKTPQIPNQSELESWTNPERWPFYNDDSVEDAGYDTNMRQFLTCCSPRQSAEVSELCATKLHHTAWQTVYPAAASSLKCTKALKADFCTAD